MADLSNEIAALYAEQLGRTPDDKGLAFYTNAVASGEKTLDQVKSELDRSTEGYNYDLQNVVSTYRDTFGRNPDQEGLQYWLGQEDVNSQGIGNLQDEIKAAAKGTDVTALANAPASGYSQLQLAALEADPFAGRYATNNPYYFGELPSDAINVSSTQAGQNIQWTNPVTGQPLVTAAGTSGSFSSQAGNNILQRANVNNALNLSLSSGALTKADYDAIQNKLDPANKNHATTWEEIYSTLGKPQATAILNNMGIQVGEDADPTKALAEVSARNSIANSAAATLPTGTVPANSVIAQQAAAQGYNYPFTDKALGLGTINTKATLGNVYNNIGTELGIAPDKKIISGATNNSGSGYFNIPQQLGSYTRPTFDIDASYNPYAMPTQQTTPYANPYQAGLDALTGYGGQIAYPVAAPTPLADQTAFGYTRRALPDVGTLSVTPAQNADAEAAPAAPADSGGARAGGLMSAYKKRMGKR